MTDKKKKIVHPNKLNAFATNAVTEVHKTVSEANLPVSSDECVEEARDWANEGNKL